MKVNIKEISESEYKDLEVPVLFEDKLDRVFGFISNGINGYKLGWHSTIIKPKIEALDDIRYSIGIDLNFIIFEFLTGKVLIELSLDYFFYDTIIHNNFIYVVTELEIIKINIVELSIVETYALTDYFERIEFNESNIIARCVNGDVVNID